MEHDPIQDILSRLLSMLAVRTQAIERRDTEPHPTYSITTEDAALLIGAGGERLKAFNHVAKCIVERLLGKEHTRFFVDVNEYQRARIDTIEHEARMLAERARNFKSAVAMHPLNAYERMIVHNLFADDPEVTTESAGIGRGRHIVFHCKRSFARAPTGDAHLIE